MNLESEDEDGEEAGDRGGTSDSDYQAHPRGSSHVTQDKPDWPWQQPAVQEEENFSDSFGAGLTGKKPSAVPGKKPNAGREESKITQSQDCPGASAAPGALPGALSHKLLEKMHPPRDSLPAGDGGDSRANCDAALGVPSTFPGTGRYSCAQTGVDTSPDNSSPSCVPKPSPAGSAQVGREGRVCECLRVGRPSRSPAASPALCRHGAPSPTCE